MIDKELLKKFEIEIEEAIKDDSIIRIRIEGKPRMGKSTLGIQLSNYLNKLKEDDSQSD